MIRRVAVTLGLVACLATRASALTFTVDSTADGADTSAGDGSCVATTGGCTLRAAIEEANAHPDLDTIAFAIPPFDGTVKTITTATNLPEIVGPVTLDGYTQDTASQNTVADGEDAKLLVDLDGAALAGVAFDLRSGADGSAIRGFVIHGFGFAGINLQQVTTCVVEGNFIGTDPTGTIARGNQNGIAISSAAANIIGGTTPAARNVIAGNRAAGIDMESGADGNTIQGTFIGVDATGANALPNGGDGMRVVGASSNLIGGTTAGARNVISGNLDDGISLQGGANGNMVEGNFFGTDVTGTKALGNAADAFFIASSSGNVIGGGTVGARNLISGNGQNGIALVNGGATGTVMQGNRIGTDVTGTLALGNASTGVVIVDGTGNTIGGTGAGEGNVIAHNGSAGVGLLDNITTGNRIVGNAIFENGGLGIDLALDGITSNDVVPGDPDGGPNNSQNFPVLAAPMFPGGSTVSGTLNSTPGHTFRIEVFANTACDPSGFGEGETFVGTVDTGTADMHGDIGFTVTFGQPLGATLLTATATDLTTHDTSEFSACPVPPTTTTTSSTTSTSSTTTSSTSTLASTTSTTSSSTLATSSSSSSTTSSSTSTSTTTHAQATTTTTPLATCAVVPAGPTFASLLCRLDALITRVTATNGLGDFQPRLLHTLGMAHDRTADARGLCAGNDPKHAGQRLKQAIRQLIQYAHRLAGLPARKRLDGTLRRALLDAGNAIKPDVVMLRKNLHCPADATP